MKPYRFVLTLDTELRDKLRKRKKRSRIAIAKDIRKILRRELR